VRHRKIEEAIIKLVSQSPRSPKEIVDSLSEQGFAVLEIRNTIWELLDSRKVEVTPDRRLEAAAPQRASADLLVSLGRSEEAEQRLASP